MVSICQKNLEMNIGIGGSNMGIKSTRDITREHAIERIIEIGSLLTLGSYVEIESNSFEDDSYCGTLKEFVEYWEPIDLIAVHTWTNKMLEDYMDTPFFRHSMFENYLIKRES